MRARYNDAMPILTARDQAAVRNEFERIAGPVKLVVFSQELAAAELCQQNEQLVREVAGLSGDGRAEGRHQRSRAVRGRRPRAGLPRRGAPGGGDVLKELAQTR